MEPITLLIAWGLFKGGQYVERRRKASLASEPAAKATAGEPAELAPRMVRAAVRVKLARAVGHGEDGSVAWRWRDDAEEKALRFQLERSSLVKIDSPPGVSLYQLVPLRAVSAWQALVNSTKDGLAVAASLTCAFSREADCVCAISETSSMPDIIRLSEHFAAVVPALPAEVLPAPPSNPAVRNGVAKPETASLPKGMTEKEKAT